MLYFTSDTHFHHVRILELCPHRPYSTVDEMNRSLISNYNAKINEDDVVIFLGDLVMGQKHETVPAVVPRLRGRKYLLLGNHDGGFQRPEEKKTAAFNHYLENGLLGVRENCWDLADFLRSVGENNLAETLSVPISICHFPYQGVADHADQHQDRYQDLKPLPVNKLLLHGHTHATEKVTSPNMIHIGVDSWNFAPVSLDEVITLYSSMKESHNGTIQTHRS